MRDGFCGLSVRPGAVSPHQRRARQKWKQSQCVQSEDRAVHEGIVDVAVGVQCPAPCGSEKPAVLAFGESEAGPDSEGFRQGYAIGCVMAHSYTVFGCCGEVFVDEAHTVSAAHAGGLQGHGDLDAVGVRKLAQEVADDEVGDSRGQAGVDHDSAGQGVLGGVVTEVPQRPLVKGCHVQQQTAVAQD